MIITLYPHIYSVITYLLITHYLLVITSEAGIGFYDKTTCLYSLVLPLLLSCLSLNKFSNQCYGLLVLPESRGLYANPIDL